MCTPLKQHKRTEREIHDQLFNNILLLTHVYPTTKDFDAVFKKDMFLKNNKAASHQVIYYLLNVLNPKLTQEKITTWPLFEAKLESKFRNEVLAYVNELNTIYEEADIPNIMPSHLISPGGFKFIRFMWKLSQLVLVEHLKKNDAIKKQILYPVKPHKNEVITNIALKTLKQKTAEIEGEIVKEYQKFTKIHERATLEANDIVEERSQVDKDLKKVSKVLEETRDSLQTNNEFLQESLNRKINYIKDNGAVMEEIKELCMKCDDLLTHLISEESDLECNKNDLVLPDSISHLRNNDKLNLHDLLSNLIHLLEQENLKMPIFTAEEVDDVAKTIEQLTEKYSRLNEKHCITENKLREAFNTFKQFAELKVVPEK